MPHAEAQSRRERIPVRRKKAPARGAGVPFCFPLASLREANLSEADRNEVSGAQSLLVRGLAIRNG